MAGGLREGMGLHLSAANGAACRFNKQALKKKRKKTHTHTACPSYSVLRGVTEPAEPVGAGSIVITATIDFPFPDFTSFIMLESFVPD